MIRCVPDVFPPLMWRLLMYQHLPNCQCNDTAKFLMFLLHHMEGTGEVRR